MASINARERIKELVAPAIAKKKLKAEIAANIKAESEAVKTSMATKMAEQRKIRLGRAGRRSLLSSSFMGVQDKAATLG